jgi:hypothetical protein
MGEIIDSRRLSNNNIVYRILLEEYEVIELRNALRNVNIFSANLFNKEVEIMKRGKSGVTKYFEVPLDLRFRKKKNYEKIFYQKIETPTKVFYIYTIPKNEIF